MLVPEVYFTDINSSENFVSDVGVEDEGSRLDQTQNQDLERVEFAQNSSQWDQNRGTGQASLQNTAMII